MIPVIILTFLLVVSIVLNVKFYRDLVLYRSAYRRTSSLASQTTLLMGAMVLLPYLVTYLQRKFSK